MAEIFSHPTDEKYKISATIKDIILHDDERLKLLAYPSVKFSGKTNFTISPTNYNKHMECYECYYFRVNNDYGYGVYSTEILYTGSITPNDGSIEWTPYTHGPQDFIF